MRFLIHREVKARAARGLEWVRAFFDQPDTRLVGWLRIDFGREDRDRRGRLHRKLQESRTEGVAAARPVLPRYVCHGAQGELFDAV